MTGELDNSQVNEKVLVAILGHHVRSEVMKDKRSRQRYSLGLSLVVLALTGWLCLPDGFPVSPGPSASAATAMTYTGH